MSPRKSELRCEQRGASVCPQTERRMVAALRPLRPAPRRVESGVVRPLRRGHDRSTHRGETIWQAGAVFAACPWCGDSETREPPLRCEKCEVTARELSTSGGHAYGICKHWQRASFVCIP